MNTNQDITQIKQDVKEIKEQLSSNAQEVHGPPMPGEQLRSVLSFNNARDILGWEPTVPLTEGLKPTVIFFKNKA